MLARRIFTALALVALLVTTIFSVGPPGVLALFGLFSFWACVEYSALIPHTTKLYSSVFVGLSFTFYLTIVLEDQVHEQLTLIWGGFAFMVLSLLAVVPTNDCVAQRMAKLAHGQMGLLYCGLLSGIASQGFAANGFHFFGVLFFASFGTDTCAYLGGTLFGKTKLVPQISPNKTVEGSLSGLVGGTAMATAYFVYFHGTEIFWPALAGCLLASAFSQVGDLFESLVKRHGGVKDSGKILPGHGGVLDRMDGLLFSAPFVHLIFLYQ